MKKLLIIFFAFQLSVNAQGFICAVGGGSENYNDWSDAPYSWIVQKARNKKIIILSYSSDVTSWLPNYFLAKGANTAYNKAISSRSAADLQSTYDELISADGIFLRGGDQYQYVSLWKGTKTEQALKDIFFSGGVIAGTSAGAMVLGEFNFTAKNGSVTSLQALNSPTSSVNDIDTSFLPLLPSVLFDTHFIERGRFGRAIAFLYKAKQIYTKNIVAIGIDDRTALCIDSLGFGTVYGSGAVAFYFADEQTKMTSPSPSYSIENLLCHQLTANWVFNFNDKTISSIPNSAKDFDHGGDYQFPKTDFYLTGSNNISSQLNGALQTFLSNSGAVSHLIITHPGYSSGLTPLTSYLASNNYQYSILQLSSSSMNDPASVQAMNSSGAFIFCGDSLSVLSLLNDGASLLSQKFYEKIENENVPVFYFGNSGKTSGAFYVDNTDSDYLASYRGKMKIEKGNNIFGDMIFQPRIFEESDFYENRVSALLLGMMRQRKRFGVYLNGNDMLKFDRSQKTVSGNGALPFMIVDARNTTKIDSSTYRASSSIGTRQVVAMNNLRYSISKNPNDVYSLVEAKFISPAKVENDIIDKKIFELHQNYPNPFNPSTKIKFAILALAPSLTRGERVMLKVYDILGREVATLVNAELSAGEYEVEFNINDELSTMNYELNTNIYFYRLTAGNFSATKKFILLK